MRSSLHSALINYSLTLINYTLSLITFSLIIKPKAQQLQSLQKINFLSVSSSRVTTQNLPSWILRFFENLRNPEKLLTYFRKPVRKIVMVKHDIKKSGCYCHLKVKEKKNQKSKTNKHKKANIFCQLFHASLNKSENNFGLTFSLSLPYDSDRPHLSSIQ